MKRGAISISFGVIFSIIMIIAIIGVAFYAINYFLSLKKCTDVALFYGDFDRAVEKAWNSEITREKFVGNIPAGINAVCFKESGENIQGAGDEYRALEDYFIEEGNMFIYPPENACDQVSRTAKHINFEGLGWKCFQARDGKIEINLEKGSRDSLVKIS